MGGVVRAETKAGLLAVVERMQSRPGIGAVILGGTEFSLTLRDGDAVVPLLDTTLVHVAAIVDQLLS